MVDSRKTLLKVFIGVDNVAESVRTKIDINKFLEIYQLDFNLLYFFLKLFFLVGSKGHFQKSQFF
jgi:hypothetical protein